MASRTMSLLTRIAIASLAMALLLAACATHDTSASPSGPGASSQPAASAPSVSPAPSGLWSSLRWSSPGILPSDLSPLDVVAWHGGYVAVGQVAGTSQSVGGVFTSSDGMHWSKIDTRRTFVDIPIRLAAMPNRLIAIGNLELPGGCPQGEGAVCTPSQAAPVWVSTDAQTWTQVNPSPFGVAYLNMLAAGPRGVVIGGQTLTGQAALWFSPDGATWERVSLPASFDHAILRDVAPTPQGFVAVGRDVQPNTGSGGVRALVLGAPAAWWSTDGMIWQAASVEGAQAPGAELSAIEVGAYGLFALGSDNPDPSKPVAGAPGWASADGKNWRRVGEVTGSIPYATQMASDGQHIVRLGPEPRTDPPDSDSLAAWVSTDGMTWEQLPLLGDPVTMPAGMEGSSDKPTMQGIYAAEEGLIVIGSHGTDFLSWFVDASGSQTGT